MVTFPLQEIDSNILAAVSLFYEIMSLDSSLDIERINFNNVIIPLYRRKIPIMPIMVFFIFVIISSSHTELSEGKEQKTLGNKWGQACFPTRFIQPDGKGQKVGPKFVYKKMWILRPRHLAGTPDGNQGLNVNVRR